MFGYIFEGVSKVLYFFSWKFWNDLGCVRMHSDTFGCIRTRSEVFGGVHRFWESARMNLDFLEYFPYDKYF